MSVEPSLKQIRKALLSYAEEELDWESFSSFMNSYGDLRGRVHHVPGIGKVRIHDYHDYDSNKNYDGWYEDVWIVFEIQGKLYRAQGKHSSYEMSEWEEELEIVEPKQVQITVYEAV